MARKRGPGGGRKPQGEFSGKFATFATRLTAETRAELERSAKRNNRSISQEAEHLLKISLQIQIEDMPGWGGQHIFAFARLLGYAAGRLEAVLGFRFRDKHWHNDPFAAQAFRASIEVIMQELAPKPPDGPMEIPAEARIYAEQMARAHRAAPETVPQYSTPEAFGTMIGSNVVFDLKSYTKPIPRPDGMEPEIVINGDVTRFMPWVCMALGRTPESEDRNSSQQGRVKFMAAIRKRTWRTDAGELKTSWFIDYRDNHGARQRKHFASKKAADAFRVGIEGQIQAGTYRAAGDKVTLVQACMSFLEHCQGRHARDERMTRKMLAVYYGHVHNHILHAEHGVGAHKLAQFTARSVGEFRDRIRNAGVTIPTARKIIATLHSVLEHAIAQDWIAANPARGIRVIGPRGEGPRKIVPPSKASMRTLLDAADDDLRLMLLFAASTGVRAGEQWAARWSDVDFDHGELSIARRVDAYGAEGAPKSLAGLRTVPLSGELLARLKAWRLKSRFSRKPDLVFPNRKGRHVGHDNLVKRRFLPLLGQLPAGNRFNWHGLRHFAVSCWIEARLPPKTIQTFAGHASLQVTMDRYGHLFPSEDHRQAMDRIATDLLRS